jgi:arginyl-tRNA synthetase
MLDFDGESAPYVQYTYARSRSILRKAGEIPADADCSVLSAPEEFELVKLLEQFKDAVADAATKYEPSIVTRQVTVIARAFNKFYNTCPILNAEDSMKNARLKLTEATCGVIRSGMQLLGIDVPERM